jgi:hypothetical protein
MNNDVFYVSVAGINYRATEEDVGPILGYTKSYPVEADPEAEGVFLKNGKLIGFIPVKRKKEYLEFKKEAQNKEGQCLFSGNIKKATNWNGESYFVGNIAIVRGEGIKELLEAHYNADFNLFGGKTPQL